MAMTSVEYTQEEIDEYFSGDGNYQPEERSAGAAFPKLAINSGANDSEEGLKTLLLDADGNEQLYVLTGLKAYKIAVWAGRSYYAGSYDASNPRSPDCWSEFGLSPHSMAGNPLGILECQSCIYSHWKKPVGGGRPTADDAPECESFYNCLVFGVSSTIKGMGEEEVPIGQPFLLPLRSYNRVYGHRRPTREMEMQGTKVLGQVKRNEVMTLTTKTVRYGTIASPQFRQELHIVGTEEVAEPPPFYADLIKDVMPMLPSREKEAEHRAEWAGKIELGKPVSEVLPLPSEPVGGGAPRPVW